MDEPTVLLVEDHPLLRWWMTSSLQHEGYSVFAPKTLGEAMTLAAVFPFDVLITDWRLAEGHTGGEVLARVREKFPQTLAILISAEASTDLPEHARALGFDVVIEKPFPPAEILGAVQSLSLGHRREVHS